MLMYQGSMRRTRTIEQKIAQPKVATISFTKRLTVMITLLLSMAGVGLLSHFVLMENSIRLDEAQSLWQTSHSVSGTLKVVAQDVHVPLYHLILHFWQFTFGQSIQTARLLSLIFFLATIPIVYLLARRILSVNWALFATVLFSFSPFLNWYANEARMYTLLMFVATLSQYFFLKIMDDKTGKKGWIGYTLTAMVGVYTHYFFMFNLLAQGIFFLLNRHDFAPKTFRKFVALAIGLLVWLSPWLYYFRSLGSASNTTPDLTRPSTVDFFNAFSQFLFGFQTDAINTIIVSTWPILVIVALMAVKSGQRVSSRVSFMLTAALLPAFIAYALSFIVTPFFLSRYMVSCVAPLIIIGVWFISYYGRSLSKVVAVLLIVVMGVSSTQQYASSATPVKEEYRQAAEIIGNEARAEDIVVLSAPFTTYPFDYYYNGAAEVATVPAWNRQIPGPVPAFDPAKLPSEIKALGEDHTNAYLLLSYDQGYQDQVFQYFEGHYPRLKAQKLSNDVNLYVYQIGYDNVPPIGEVKPAQ